MDENPRVLRAQRVAERLESGTTLQTRIPMHVYWRLAELLVDGEELEYADDSLPDVGEDARGGLVVIFTKRRVVIATVDVDEPTTVRVIRRGELRGVEIRPDGARNDNEAWAGEYTNWPVSRAVTAVYADGTEVTLPLSPTPRRAKLLDAFLPALLADLDKQ